MSSSQLPSTKAEPGNSTMSNASAIETVPARIEPNRASQYLVWTIATAFPALLLWATFAEVDETATASGRVVPSRQLQVVSNLEGGVVKAIFVSPGARVNVGQPLIQLDNTQFSADFGKTSDYYDALTARTARLQAEVSGRTPEFPAGLVQAAPQLVSTEGSLFRARASELSASSSVEVARLEQARRGLGQAEVDAAMRVEAAHLAEREVAMIAPLVEKGIEPQIELVRAQSAQSQARGVAAGAALAVHRARSSVAEAGSSLRAVRERFRAQSVEQLTQARADLANQRAALPALRDRVRRTDLRAPISGIVNRVLIATVGGSVRPGEPLVEIVPADDSLVVEAEVRPADIAFLHIGQHATVKLTAYDYYVYGGLDGRVESISPDAIANDRTGESHFKIRVRTRDAALKARDGTRLPIGAGMMAEVNVLGQKRSILSYLLTPFSRLRENAFREK
jgi:adhesin transport system membrane fusion protein